MVTDWMKVRPDICDRTEIMQIADILDMAEEAVVGHIIRIWGHAHVNLDTNETKLSPSRIDRIARLPGLTSAMVEVGWAEVVDGKVWLVGWVEWTGVDKAKQKITADRERMRANRDAFREKKKKEKSERSTNVAELSRERSANVAATPFDCSVNVAELSRERSANVAELSRERSGVKKRREEKRREENNVLKDIDSVGLSRDDDTKSAAAAAPKRSVPTAVEVADYLASSNHTGGIILSVSDCQLAAAKYHADRSAVGWVTKTGLPIADWQADLRHYALSWTQNSKSAIQQAATKSRNTGTANDPATKQPAPEFSAAQIAEFERIKAEAFAN